jgi:hypothetical protein
MNNPTMRPRGRKWALTAHIVFSVGWAGAAAGFLALSIAGVTSQNPEVVRAAYVGMNLSCCKSTRYCLTTASRIR